jgi:hypothetical protein
MIKSPFSGTSWLPSTRCRWRICPPNNLQKTDQKEEGACDQGIEPAMSLLAINLDHSQGAELWFRTQLQRLLELCWTSCKVGRRVGTPLFVQARLSGPYQGHSTILARTGDWNKTSLSCFPGTGGVVDPCFIDHFDVPIIRKVKFLVTSPES